MRRPQSHRPVGELYEPRDVASARVNDGDVEYARVHPVDEGQHRIAAPAARVAQPEADPMDDEYGAESFDEFLRTDRSAQYAMRQGWAKRMETAINADELLESLKKVGCSAEYPQCSNSWIMNGSQLVCSNHAVSVRLWTEMVPSATPPATAAESPILAYERWLLCWVADNGRKLTQTEAGIAYAAFIAAHPGEGPRSHTMSATAAASSDWRQVASFRTAVVNLLSVLNPIDWSFVFAQPNLNSDNAERIRNAVQWVERAAKNIGAPDVHVATAAVEAARDEINKLTAVLISIEFADTSCQCDHDSPECCAVAGEFCAKCWAHVALSDRSVADSSAVMAATIAEAMKPYFTNDCGAAEKAGIKASTIFNLAEIIRPILSRYLPIAEQAAALPDLDWALRELADGWISNNEREGEYGFNQDARRVMEVLLADSAQAIARFKSKVDQFSTLGMKVPTTIQIGDI